ncbi:hypothetical protein TURU_034550 [Turdus rufiventris]|nr:hypothetical protein TURU_034550 [Turdus rufiventris]
MAAKSGQKLAENHHEKWLKRGEKWLRKMAEKRRKIAAKCLQIENLPVIHYFVAHRAAPRCKNIVRLIVWCPLSELKVAKVVDIRGVRLIVRRPIPAAEIGSFTQLKSCLICYVCNRQLQHPGADTPSITHWRTDNA